MIGKLLGQRSTRASDQETPSSASRRQKQRALRPSLTFKAIGADVERAWHSAGATAATRKRIIRTLIEEIIVRVVDDALDLVIRWAGGDHTPLRVRKNRVGEHRWSTDADVVELVAVLARQLPDKAIAAILNRAGKKTGRGNGWTRSRVCMLRNHRGIAPHREGERTERGEVTLEEAAEALEVSEATVRRLIADEVLPAAQHCKGAPWVIRAADLQDETVKRAADARRQRRPASADPRQNVLAL